MSVRRFNLTVMINGQEVGARTVRTAHDVDTPVGTASITLRAPRPASLFLGAPVVIWADYVPIFSGTIAEDDAIFDAGGGEIRIECEGHARRLFYRNYTDVGYTGPMRLDVLFRNLCRWRGVPLPFADVATAPDGTPLMLGANPNIENGWIALERSTSPADLITRACKLWGYRWFDQPTGWTRLRNLTGLPRTPIENLPLLEEGVDFLSIARASSWDGMANYWEALGAEYKIESTGEEVSIRNIPATVTPDPMRYGPDGINRVAIGRDALLSTDDLARAARNAHEINYSADQHRWRWQITGHPIFLPGAEVAIISPTVNGLRDGTLVDDLVGSLPRGMWIMRVEHSISDAGWTTTMEGWAGAGQAIPAGDDCVSQTLVGPEGFHIGNEWLSHYRLPNPSGLEVSIPFEVAADYSTLSIRYDGHGCNSFVGNTESTASRFEIWQTWHNPDRAVASGEMPRQNENLEQRYPYTEDAYWDNNLVVPLSGSLKAGSAILKIISGYDSNVGDYDDYECKNVRLTTCGIGEPEIIS